jgi:quercetin dioxygenase-like cupin family protein
MKAYHYGDVDAEPVQGNPDVRIRWIIGENVDAPNFYTRIIEVEPGEATEYHQHAWEHEVFVLDGEGTVHHANGKTLVGPGICVYVEPNEIHQFVNTGESLLRFICIIPKPE